MRFLLIFLLLPSISFAANGVIEPLSVPAFTVQASDTGFSTYSVNIQILAIMTALTVLPALLLGMTSFTRIIIVFGILRQAIGLQQTPSNQILLGLALFLTFFLMNPIVTNIYETSLVPYMENKVDFQQSLDLASTPIKEFMLKQTREADLEMFLSLKDKDAVLNTNELMQVPFSVIAPAFLTSEIKTAFQIGFLIFIPFLIIDLVVASVLMAMGMMMLSPLIISLPFKIMLFVLVDGWSLIVGTLSASFGI